MRCRHPAPQAGTRVATWIVLLITVLVAGAACAPSVAPTTSAPSVSMARWFPDDQATCGTLVSTDGRDPEGNPIDLTGVVQLWLYVYAESPSDVMLRSIVPPCSSCQTPVRKDAGQWIPDVDHMMCDMIGCPVEVDAPPYQWINDMLRHPFTMVREAGGALRLQSSVYPLALVDFGAE